MKSFKNINLLVVSGFLLELFIAYNLMNGNSVLASNLITLSFFYVFGLFFGDMSHNNKELVSLLKWCIPLVFLNVTFSGLGNFDYYKKAIMFSTTMMWMVYTTGTRISKKTAYIICVVMLLLNISYQLFYKSGLSIYEGEVLLDLGFSNPNLAGLFIVNSMLYLGVLIVAGQELFESKSRYILNAVIATFVFLITFNILLLTGCRSAILSLFAFGALVVADIFFLHKNKPRKWFCYIVAVAPFLFVFFYVFYIQSIKIDVSFGLEDSGKSSTTRLGIWSPFVNNFLDYFFFGDYYGISNGTGVSQLHNTHLDVYASYGIVPLILYVTLLARVIWSTWVRAVTRFQRYSVYAFVATLVVSTFEAGFVAGSAGLFLLTCGFLLLSNASIDENSTNK